MWGMAEDIDVSVIPQNFKVSMIGRQPAVEHLEHLDAARSEPKTSRRLLATVTTVAFHTQLIHVLSPASLKQYSVMHKAQARLESGECSIEIEIGIDSVQLCLVRLDTDSDTDFDFDFDFDQK
jgi:hypothetical protein